MKTQLTKAQSQQLIELGFPKWKVQEIKPSDISLKDWTPTITLTDLLEILPKAINVPLKGRRELLIHYANINGNDCPLVCYTVPYDAMGGIVSPCHKKYEELIDALYELCVWCLENKYLNFKGQ